MSRMSLGKRFWRTWDRHVPMARNIPFWGTVFFLGTPTLAAMYFGDAHMFPDQNSVSNKESQLVIPRTPDLPGSPEEQQKYYQRKYSAIDPAAAAAVPSEKQPQQQLQQVRKPAAAATSAAQPASSAKPSGIRFSASGSLQSSSSSSVDAAQPPSPAASAESSTTSPDSGAGRRDLSLAGTRIDPLMADEVLLFGRTPHDVLREAAGLSNRERK